MVGALLATSDRYRKVSRFGALKDGDMQLSEGVLLLFLRLQYMLRMRPLSLLHRTVGELLANSDRHRKVSRFGALKDADMWLSGGAGVLLLLLWLRV